MIRTQLYLPDELSNELKLLAQQLNISVAETTRKAISKGLSHIKEKPQNLDSIVGMIKSDKAPKNLSENLDKYLFGQQ